MKKNILKWMLVIAVYGVSNYAFGQSKLTDEQKNELIAKMEHYRTALNLSEEQQEKVKSINAAYFEGLAGLETAEGSRLSKFKQFRTLSETRDEQMKRVLDKDQYKRFREMQKEIKNELKNHRKS